MAKILSQDEIDALFTAAQGPGKPAPAKRRKIEKYDLRVASRLSANQVRVVTTLHESLARRLGNSLGAYLRVGFEMQLVSAELLTYGEFLTRLPELTYAASLHMMPIDARAIFQTDLSLVFPFVDLVLGGSGSDPIDPRELTEIEEQIFEAVVCLVARDLQITWAPLVNLEIQFEQRQQYAQIHGLMLPQEKILSLSFEIRLPDARGQINFAFPAVVANTLLRKLAAQGSVGPRLPSRQARRQLRDRLLECSFTAHLNLPACQLSVKQLVSLEPGSVLVLPKHAHDPVHLDVAGKPMFLAYPVRSGNRRGARIQHRLSISEPGGQEIK